MRVHVIDGSVGVVVVEDATGGVAVAVAVTSGVTAASVAVAAAVKNCGGGGRRTRAQVMNSNISTRPVLFMNIGFVSVVVVVVVVVIAAAAVVVIIIIEYAADTDVVMG